MSHRTQELTFGPNLFVIVKHFNESTRVKFLFDNEEEPPREFNLEIEILKEEPVFFIERFMKPGSNTRGFLWEVKMYQRIEGRFVVEWLNGTNGLTSDQREDFRMKWQEVVDQLINEDTFTFQIPTFLTEVLAIENELFQLDLE